MRKKLFYCVIAAALLSAAACQTTRPPHVPLPPGEVFIQDAQARKAAATRAAVGTITVSTPMARALTEQPVDNDRLDFGTAKTEDSLRTAIRSANMSRSIMQYEALKAALAVNVAGTQVSSTNTSETSGGVGGSLDPIKLLTSLLAVSSGTPGAVANPEDIATLKADFSAKASASHTESFKSPEVPGAPTAPSVPDSVQAKLLALLGPATGGFHLDPSQEARLIASYKTYMNALEDFYNAENVATYLSLNKKGESVGKWHPYRVVFSVSVDPGWYPFLKQYDGVVDLDFSPSELGSGVHVVNVMPAEAAQTVDELTASLTEVASALTLAGGFEAAALNAKLEQLNALAQRLEGSRKQTNLVVSYPAQDTVRIRIRPSVVASLNLAETQPTNIVFAATVLVGEDLVKDREVKDRSVDLRATPKPINTTKSVARQMRFSARFEPQTKLKRKGWFPWTSAPHLFGPSLEQQNVLPVMFGEMGEDKDVALELLFPTWPPEDKSKLGFTKDPAGFYDSDGTTATGYISYSIKNPDGASVNLFADDGNAQPLGSNESLQGVLKVENIKINGASGDPIRVFLRATADKNTEVRVATLIPRVQLEPTTPTVSIDTGGVKAEDVPLGPASTDLVKALKAPPEKACCKTPCCICK